MSELSREQIKAIDDRKIRKVEVPAWGGHVLVRTLTVGERERLEAPMTAQRGRVDITGYRARVVVAATVNEDGSQKFQAGDESWLNSKAAAAIEPIAEAAMEFNGMTDSAVQDAAGNSEGDPGGASFTGSPSPSDGPWPTSDPA